MRGASRLLDKFFAFEASTGIVLLATTAIAMTWANSPWRYVYFAILDMPLGVRLGSITFERNLAWVVNDVLMVVFFFVAGLEIRREIHTGALATPSRAALPLAAAIGGMVVPAGLYLVLAGQPSTRHGWGVPMATDIAFALGILGLLGRRVPSSLRALLLALAVLDDLGAIIVIAIFYSAGIAWQGLAVAGLGLGAIVVFQRMGVRSWPAYLILGTIAWAGTYASGVHPTISGVAIGLLTPVDAMLTPSVVVKRARSQLERLTGGNAAQAPRQQEALTEVKGLLKQVRSPGDTLTDALHPWVNYGIMPIFALANAGVALGTFTSTGPPALVATAVGVGLLVGKPLGILAASAIVLRFNVARLPRELSFRHLLVLGVVAGIGFTMSLFIAELAFEEPELLTGAKVGVLVASALAVVLGLALGRMLLRRESKATK